MRSVPPRLALLVLAQLLSAAASARAQITIPDTPSCKTCTITVGSRLLVLGDGTSPVGGIGHFVARISRSRFLVGGAGVPEAFGSNGASLGPLGRKGAGPAEFLAAGAFISGPGDSTAVFDPRTGRIQIFDERLVFVRAFSFGQGVTNGGALWVAGDSPFITAGLRSGPTDSGFMLHLYGGDGTYRRSIAESHGSISPSTAAAQSQVLLTRFSTGEVVSVTAAEAYDIERWDLRAGTRIGQWTRDAPWFGAQYGPFNARVVSAVVDSAGLLWTLIAVPSPEWKKGVRPRTIGEGRQTEQTFDIVDRNQIIDSFIEVIDLQLGTLVAQVKLDRAYVGLLPGRLLAAESQGAGTPRLEIFPVVLHQP